MNKTIATTAAFLLGAAAGAAGAWYILKEHYAQIAQEEIDSVKETFGKLYDADKNSTEKTEDIPDEEDPEPSIAENQEMQQKAKKMITTLDYTSYSVKPEIDTTEEHPSDKPYVITPDEFGEFEDYETISLTFYADQIVCDDNNEPLENLNDVIGFESLNHFGEYEDDSVYVRNDRLKCDYEILLDMRKYEDVLKTMPHQKGVL